MNIQVTIEFSERRCTCCGTWWAVEKPREQGVECPKCAGREVQKARERLMAVERSYNALKANFTRLKAKVL